MIPQNKLKLQWDVVISNVSSKWVKSVEEMSKKLQNKTSVQMERGEKRATDKQEALLY